MFRLVPSTAIRRTVASKAAPPAVRRLSTALAGVPEETMVNAFGGKYQWDDPLLLRDQLTEEERMMRDAAHSFCQGELQPTILMANRHEDSLDHKLMKEMGQVGLLGATIPSQYGGSGLGYVSYGLIATEVERVDS